MNWNAIASLSVAICSITIGILIWRLAKLRLHRHWALFNFAVTIWATGSFIASTASTPHNAIAGWKIAYGLGVFVPIFFYHFVYLYCQINRPRQLFFVYFVGILYIPLIFFTELFINSTQYLFNTIHYHVATPSYTLFLLYLIIILVIAFTELINYQNKVKGQNKVQAKWLFWCFLLGWTGGFTTMLPPFGIQIYPAWHFSICIYSIIMTYAIIRIKLLSLEIVIKRSLVYSLSITVVTIMFLASVIIIEKLSQAVLGYQTSIASILAAILIGIIFSPVRNKIQRIVDKRFFKGTTQELANQNDLLRVEATQKEKFKAVATLASGMAHEIRNPLTAIKTFTEHLPNKRDDKEFIDKFAKIVGNEVQRVDELVKQLLEFARPAPLNLKNIDINSLLKETLNFLNNKLIDQQINLKTEFDANKPLIIKADANQLKQAFLNLLLNAIDAMPDGGTLTVGINEKNKNSKPYVEITIKDTGTGIDKESAKHIFEPFYSNKDHGTGLGLSITYSIIQEHKGNIQLQSLKNKGTTFTIQLPKKEQN